MPPSPRTLPRRGRYPSAGASTGTALSFGRLAQQLAGLGQDRPDRVLGNAELLADLTIVLILEMIEPDDFGLALGQILQHALDFLCRDDRLGLIRNPVVQEGTVGVGMPQLLFPVPLDQLPDA